MRVNLQRFSDGYIYRNNDRTYTVETSLGTGNGATVEQALKDLSKKLNTVTELPKPKRKKTKNHIADTSKMVVENPDDSH